MMQSGALCTPANIFLTLNQAGVKATLGRATTMLITYHLITHLTLTDNIKIKYLFTLEMTKMTFLK